MCYFISGRAPAQSDRSRAASLQSTQSTRNGSARAFPTHTGRAGLPPHVQGSNIEVNKPKPFFRDGSLRFQPIAGNQLLQQNRHHRTHPRQVVQD